MTDAAPRGIAWAGAVNLVGGITGAAVGLVLAAVVGRHLGTEGAGTYFLVVAAFMIVSNVVELGADTGLVRFVSAARAMGRLDVVPGLVAIGVRPVLVAGLGTVAVVAAWVLGSSGGAAGLPGGFVVALAAGAVLSSLVAVVLAVVRGFGDVVAYPVLQNIALPVLRLAGILVVVAAGGGVTAVLTAWVAPVPVVLAVCVVVATTMMRRRSGSIRPRTSLRTGAPPVSREFWSFSSARGLSSAAEILLEWSDVILVGALASPEEAGIYAVVTRCARAGEVIQQAARVAVGPQISGALARGAVEEAGRLYGMVTAAMIWLAWPLFIVLAVFSDTVLSVFGPGFERGASSLAVLSVAMGLATAAGTVQTILLMGGRSRWQLADKSIALVLNIGLNLVLVPWLGILGAAVAWAVTIVLDTVIVVYQVQRLMGVRARRQALWVAAGLAAGVVGTMSVVARVVLGSSLGALVMTVVVVGTLYLALSVPLRHRLGLVELVRHRG